MTVPAGAIDNHAHVMVGEQGGIDGAAYQPFSAPVQSFVAHLRGLGFSRGVLVTPSTYGADNSVLLDALRSSTDLLRGIAVVPPDVDDATLDELHAAGVRGCRVQDRMTGGLPIDALPKLASRVGSRGWHVEVWTDLLENGEIVRSCLRSTTTPILLDHLGNLPAPAPGEADAGTAVLRELMAYDTCWVTLSGAYRLAAPLAEAHAAELLQGRVDTLLSLAPERLAWGSDWPYVRPPGPVPTASDHLAVLDRWLPDASSREQVLVTNAALLYGWS
ncbi:amidohydrolase family protein [Tenggerimyces flavus]|uniref:Amidohydrolase family protein n=1 Tax=Tenggerimyces flavus TaxID=1708749 RepID=A0ABV7Y3N4_9ACTN|nr:amidohydrolase family protein [Tenggerimyces flavus]MBM7790717.1 putative TIM-barrel fold metal-dependent hydrolase [Tenggerimyces flavus]